MIIDPIFIYTFNWRVEWAAITTVLSAAFAMCLMIISFITIIENLILSIVATTTIIAGYTAA